MKTISIRHATLHNLKNISLEIPRQQIVAITGVSGSGKSTLAFDLVYEQGRRRYLRSIGMLTDLAEETGCERITGLGPTVAVQQGIIRQSNPRSSVGTRSEIFTLLRMCFVYEGRRACPGCGEEKRANETCRACGQPADGLHTGYFSYNSPLGMCLRCQGRGYTFELNMEKLLPEPETTLRQMLANTGSSSTFNYLMKGMLKEYADLPFRQAPDEQQRHILYGIPLGDGRVSHNLFDHLRWKMLKGREVNDCIRHSPCPECGGDRVCQDARQITLLGQHIGQVSRLTLTELEAFVNCLSRQPAIGTLTHNLVEEILLKINNLRENGLAHLTLYRSLPSLSGGELQRLFLASHIDSQLDSLIYILDEPTVGLHELEKQRLLKQLRQLRDLGNSILLVEHDPHMILAADSVVDIGPLAGAAGGEVMYQGEPLGLRTAPGSITGRYLAGQEQVPGRNQQPVGPGQPALRLLNVATNNLRGVDVTIPLGRLVGVAGVSGSGKSSLVMKTLVPLLERHFARRAGDSEEEGEEEQTIFFSGRLEGADPLRDFYAVSQQPIGRHDNSNPATYLKIWDPIRQMFARSPDALDRGFTAGHFSFNADGACPTCSGSGKQRMWLGGSFFTSRVCPECQGRRFQAQVLEVRLRGKNILDVLELTSAEACEFFAETPTIRRVLEVLVRSGMGYLPIGQPAPTLSGGEAQRIKLAFEISRAHKGQILYILDEPTIGLSLYDTSRLLQLLEELLQRGNSVLVVEHDPIILSRCDWLIELGPGGGCDGGQVIATGAPADLKANPHSLIGAFLNE